jgi:hypothetical protein
MSNLFYVSVHSQAKKVSMAQKISVTDWKINHLGL